MSIRKLLLLVSDIAHAPPSIVMRLVYLDGILVASLAILKVLIRNILVATQRMRIRKVGIDLYSSCKEFQRGFMLLLQTVAIAHHAPSLWRR